ncbi:hypothetical protein [Homoserinimonas sp. OAct 916]|uniref:hypothetical protein n=1 Tax=Homoserinimonas sp. OAct 916 TaxID=2211450 RepID=UPI0013004C55|nr:hypothetical protein [Homoserinimonas sp. OAct 916]
MWDSINGFDINKAGYPIVGVFLVTWVNALAIWKLGHLVKKWSIPATTVQHRRGSS